MAKKSGKQIDREEFVIEDHIAIKLCDMLLKMKVQFLDTPEGQEDFAQWHLKKYGCLLDESSAN